MAPGWGDDEAQGDANFDLPPRFETDVDVNGVKTITTVRTNDMGQKIKTERTVKVTKTTVKIPKAVLERRKWNKFGAEKHKPAGYHGRGHVSEWVTLDVNEQLLDMKPKQVVAEERNESAERAFEKMNAGTFEAWRPKNRGDAVNDVANRMGHHDHGGPGGGGLAALAEGGGRGGYVPPSLRNADGSRNAELAQRDDSCTVRVSNLSEDVKDSDLRELFRRFGGIQRIYLAKDKETHQSRGFAFINFYNREDAAQAIATLDGHGYDHLILSVSWANPTAQAPQQAPPSGLGAFPALGSGAGGGGARDPSGRPLFGARAGGAPSRGDAGMEQKYDNHIHSSSLDRFR
ncbi:hypothetical protein EMIHUDRAFT_442993 [Emiliania huxleyi CCMP1516]|uniref:Eukaryotic translation initiation factor 3 subunit G n=2 Tax=Emiliania huxleyi TaxID=2903 RepID=A0A0D3JPA3_EMIH1|nr:hypothetical protein EMIHUDRAFT_443688 [Emiliania huxleyi CCMP1516]XP_005780556.1 hypothetical protein EMIHUDRAFT_442993 [Emiliania huxleyi CCMP1516]EOD25338.1 hypothetical protein EMIHUDRAFT_443688 [Emiliania huxleyi CCMP1516]EOD28127.1 hypothetical protein EMIHUDRAFT_442993 [Emiliania huxleyi CCMP1516]|eukprot:XP_005777767.1 hypothetical protein EMIHUDRAFT_443688 [Emiliania huxleyi CCMP1516]